MNNVPVAAVQYAARGFRVIPVAHCSKKPVSKGWQQLRLDQVAVGEVFGGASYNVGVLLGEPSDWLIDVDLDHKRCLGLADQYLPPTPAVFGRPGKPRSHRLYRVTQPVATKKFKSNSAGMLVEVRSTGAQTVFPPSTHESGEMIEWEAADAEPALIDPDVLLDAVQRLADAVKFELGEKAKPTPKKAQVKTAQQPSAGTDGDADGDDRDKRCFQAMLRMQVADNKDGSGRLFAATCRCVEHDLTDEQALQVIRRYASERPFPVEWSDDQILARLRDAEARCERGGALGERIDGDDEDEERKSQADILVELAQSAEFFHVEDDAYVSFDVNGHRETGRVSRRAFRNWLSRRLYEESGKVPGGQALQDALNTLAGQALFDGPELPIAVRTAECEGAYWVDLCDAGRRCVRIDRDGWTVVESKQVPVRFVRPKAMNALPVPQHGGSIESLRAFVNIRDEHDWVLLVGWLVAAMRPHGPYAVLNVQGEQGTAKTTLSRMVRALVDPNRAPVRSEPRDARDLMIAAKNSRVVALDNLSSIPVWLSDALCRLATGGGFATRELFTDDAEAIFDSTRPIILNGIEPCATRPDLVDRCVTLTLEVISEDRRVPEADLWRDFDRALPGILGAFYSAISVAMRRLPQVCLTSIPRMADFCVWVVAAEPGLGLQDGQFLAAYQGDRGAAQQMIVESSPVGVAILKLLDRDQRWEGTQTELLLALGVDEFVAESTRRTSDWPKTARKLSNDLRRLAPALRSVGVSVILPSKPTGHQKRLVTVLERVGKSRPAPSAHPAYGDGSPVDRSNMQGVAGGHDTDVAPQHSAPTPAGIAETLVAVCAERAEGNSPGCSDSSDCGEDEEVIEV